MYPVIVQGVVGSSAYGLARPGSDVDRLGIVLAPTRELLGLGAAALLDYTHVERAPLPDRTLHELGKYVRLALVSNPTVLELLFLSSYEVLTPGGEALVAARELFPSTELVRSAYGGYAMQQATRLLARHEAGQEGFEAGATSRTQKNGRHCLRLLHMGTELLRTGTLTLDVSPYRDELFAAGELAASDPAAFKTLFEQRRAAMDAVPSVLRKTPARKEVSELLTELRLSNLV